MLTYLDRHGEDLSPLIEGGWDSELLRDSSYWINAREMEELLAFLGQRFAHAAPQNLATEVGKLAPELRCWGVLDSVLKLMTSPQDIFGQPSRWFSYFISPPPPVETLSRTAGAVSFAVPLDASEYPNVVEYLRSSLESLPQYSGKNAGRVEWEGSSVIIHWTEAQENFFTDEDASIRKALHPDLVRTVLRDLEESQRRLESTKLELAAKTEEVRKLKDQLKTSPDALPLVKSRQTTLGEAPRSEIDGIAPVPARSAAALSDLKKLSHPFKEQLKESLDQGYRLNDYLARATQLITLLVGQGRANTQVMEAMRRTDWNNVQNRAQALGKDLIHNLQNLQKETQPLASETKLEVLPSKQGDAHV